MLTFIYCSSIVHSNEPAHISFSYTHLSLVGQLCPETYAGEYDTKRGYCVYQKMLTFIYCSSIVHSNDPAHLSFSYTHLSLVGRFCPETYAGGYDTTRGYCVYQKMLTFIFSASIMHSNDPAHLSFSYTHLS